MDDLLLDIFATYNGSNGEATLALYRKLEARGPVGIVAVNLFRACKNSEPAKVYRGGIRGKGSYRSMAYDRKDWAMKNLCYVLGQHAEAHGILWGWGHDARTVNFEHVLYVEVPHFGQVSFHHAHRYDGPDYGKPWDGVRGASVDRICRWCAQILGEKAQAA